MYIIFTEYGDLYRTESIDLSNEEQLTGIVTLIDIKDPNNPVEYNPETKEWSDIEEFLG
jgi:hypothetical protein